MERIKQSLLAVGLGLVLVACGGGSGSEGDQGGDSASGTDAGAAASLVMVDNAFEPVDLTVGAGAELELTNQGEAPHNLTIEGTSIDEDLDAGGSSTVTVDAEPGTYTMFCEFHRSAGMEGTVTIQ